jgi:hypothetical protein
MPEHIKWEKNLLYLEIFVLFRQEILLNGKLINRVTYIFIIWGKFGSKLFSTMDTGSFPGVK